MMPFVSKKDPVVENKGKPVKKNEFRLNNKKLHLTYAGHLDANELFKFINEIKTIEFYSLVHEIGETGYAHTHFLFQTFDNIASRKTTIFDFKGIHPNIEIVNTNLHFRNTVKYHKKQGQPVTNIVSEDKEIKKSKTILDTCDREKGCPVDLIKKGKGCVKCTNSYNEKREKESVPMGAMDFFNNYDNLSEAVADRCQTNIKEFQAMRALMKLKPTKYIERKKVKFLDFQKTLLDYILMQDVDPRAVLCVISSGGHGKTVFLKWMVAYFTNIFVSTHCNGRDIATTLIDAKTEGNEIGCVIINLPRTYKMTREDYQGLEMIKDGFITSQKYKGEPMIWNVPHVIIFTNTLPEFSELSDDKWDVREIVESKKKIFITTNDGENIMDYELEEMEISKNNTTRKKTLERHRKVKKALEEQGFSMLGEKFIDSKPIKPKDNPDFNEWDFKVLIGEGFVPEKDDELDSLFKI